MCHDWLNDSGHSLLIADEFWKAVSFEKKKDLLGLSFDEQLKEYLFSDNRDGVWISYLTLRKICNLTVLLTK